LFVCIRVTIAPDFGDGIPPPPDFGAPPMAPVKPKTKKATAPAKSVKMKVFHWKPVPMENIGNTLWAELKEEKAMFDSKDFESKFANVITVTIQIKSFKQCSHSLSQLTLILDIIIFR
jgi:hypothetical protein